VVSFIAYLFCLLFPNDLVNIIKLYLFEFALVKNRKFFHYKYLGHASVCYYVERIM
jgi:hypothetical protein